MNSTEKGDTTDSVSAMGDNVMKDKVDREFGLGAVAKADTIRNERKSLLQKLSTARQQFIHSRTFMYLHNIYLILGIIFYMAVTVASIVVLVKVVGWTYRDVKDWYDGKPIEGVWTVAVVWVPIGEKLVLEKDV